MCRIVPAVKRRIGLIVRIIAIIAIVVGMRYLLRGLNLAALRDALATARIWPIAVAIVLSFANLLCKSACWHLMLAPRHRVPLMRLFRYTIVAFAASAIAPARAGEVLRVWVLKRRDGVPAADSAAVAVGEKLIDGVSMLILVAPLPWLLPGLPPWVGKSIALCAVIAVVAFVGFRIALSRVRIDAKSSWMGRFFAGMAVLRSPGRLFASLGVLTLSWILDLAQVSLILYAVGIHRPFAAGLLILFTLNLAILAPSTPGGVGALELGALGALDLLHVPHEPALAFALLYHAMQIVPLILVGLALEGRLVLGLDHSVAMPPAEGEACGDGPTAPTA